MYGNGLLLGKHRVSGAINHIFNSFGHSSIVFLDDFAGCACAEAAHIAYEKLGQLLEEAGLDQARQKCIPPTVELTFLGVRINTVTMTCHIPDDKLEHDSFV